VRSQKPRLCCCLWRRRFLPRTNRLGQAAAQQKTVCAMGVAPDAPSLKHHIREASMQGLFETVSHRRQRMAQVHACALVSACASQQPSCPWHLLHGNRQLRYLTRRIDLCRFKGGGAGEPPSPFRLLRFNLVSLPVIRWTACSSLGVRSLSELPDFSRAQVKCMPRPIRGTQTLRMVKLTVPTWLRFP
jgi:hypothetical protein